MCGEEVHTEKFGIEKKNRYTTPKAIDRCLRTPNGTDASSPIFHSTKRNNKSKTPGTAKRPTMMGELQGRRWPPHCIAMKRQHMEAISKRLPPRSSLKNKRPTPRPLLGVFTFPSGCSFSGLKNTVTSPKTTAPKGKLLVTRKHKINDPRHTHIQKHHRHSPRSANKPPTTGPTPILTPNALTNSPKKKGRWDRGKVFVTTAKEPCINPAAPHPATALPRMKTAEEGATAQSTLPTNGYISLPECTPYTHYRLESIRRTFEHPHRNKIQHLDISHFIQFPQCGLQCCEREKIHPSIPCEMVEGVEGIGYGQQDGVEDYGVEGYEKGA